MCLVGVDWRSLPGRELLIVANRDEFHDRPTAPAGFWPDAPEVFGGRDLKQGGSWLAVSTRGRLAAVTNVRRMEPPNPEAPSRGALVADFVRGRESAARYAERLRPVAARYAGFNLLLYDGSELRYLDNHPEFDDVPVMPGVHVVSNARLDTLWPKSVRLKASLERTGDTAELFDALGDRTRAPDAELPDTGVGPELERLLSPPFIVSDAYGTRCGTVVRFTADAIEFTERRFDATGGQTGETVELLRPTASR